MKLTKPTTPLQQRMYDNIPRLRQKIDEQNIIENTDFGDLFNNFTKQ